MSGSKFSVLHVDDDSDSENIPAGRNVQQPSKQKKAVNGSQKKGELIIHSVERQRPKTKKNKTKVVDPATGYVLQDELDVKKQEIRQAITRSSSDTPSPPTEAARDTKEGSSKPNNGAFVSPTNGRIEELLVECTKQLELTNEELAKSRSQADYYKDRYKKLFELFKDTEFADRARLAADLGRSRTNVLDLTAQLAIVTAQLEQTRSRLGVYEGKK